MMDFVYNSVKLAPQLSAAIIAAQYGNMQAREVVINLCNIMSREGGKTKISGDLINVLLDSSIGDLDQYELDNNGYELLEKVTDELMRVRPEVPSSRAQIVYIDQQHGVGSDEDDMLNHSVRSRNLHDLFRKQKRIQIVNIFKNACLEKAYDSLRRDVPWVLLTQNKGKLSQYTHKQILQLTSEQNEKFQENCSNANFIHQQFNPIKKITEDLVREKYIYRLIRYIKSSDFISFMRHLTGCEEIRTISVRGTCFSSGQYLKQHDDYSAESGRLYAYTINMTPKWEAEWGGLLHFLDPQQDIADTIVPRYNSLNVFSVPCPHFVSPVASYSEQSRFSLAGWFHG